MPLRIFKGVKVLMVALDSQNIQTIRWNGLRIWLTSQKGLNKLEKKTSTKLSAMRSYEIANFMIGYLSKLKSVICIFFNLMR